MSQRRGNGLSATEAARLVEGYEEGKQTRREYCRGLGIPVTTLDYYRRRQARKGVESRKTRLVAVEVVSESEPGGFTLVLKNGRRIESNWGFGGEQLARLIRVAEQA